MHVQPFVNVGYQIQRTIQQNWQRFITVRTAILSHWHDNMFDTSVIGTKSVGGNRSTQSNQGTQSNQSTQSTRSTQSNQSTQSTQSNQSNQSKPPNCSKSLTNFITYYCIEYNLPWVGFKLTTLVVIGTDFTGSCKSNYHTITTTTAPKH
jgi:hypothetical protein